MVETSVRPREHGRPSDHHTPDAEALAGLYSFGVLEGGELARFERHLAGCGRCAEVVDGDRVAVMAMGLTAPEAEAAPDLKDRLLARAAAELAEPPTERPAALAPIRLRAPEPSRWRWLLPVAAMLLVLLGGGALLGRELTTTQVVAAAPMENRSGRGEGVVLVRRNGEGVVQLRDLGDLPGRQVYQAWVIPQGGTPIPTGASQSGDGTLALDRDLRGATVAVTLEPGPGAQAPSTQPFLVGRVPA